MAFILWIWSWEAGILSDFSAILQVIKQAAGEAAEGMKPADIFTGRVESEAPLRIYVEQKMALTEDELILTERVTEHKVEMTVEHYTENYYHTHEYTDDGTRRMVQADTHRHDYRGRKVFIVHGGLKEGERVIIMRAQGGQKFVVIDRIGGGEYDAGSSIQG